MASSDPARDQVLQLRPGTAVLDRGGGEVQLGTDERWSLVVSGLDEAEVRWLRSAVVARHACLEKAAARHGVGAQRRDEISQLLTASGFLVPAARRVPDMLATASGAADAVARGALLPQGDGLLTIARRSARTVGVVGLGRIGASLAANLATAGVGGILLDDDATVEVVDLGLGTYGPADVGLPRAERLAALLSGRHRHTRLQAAAAGDLPDAVVIIRDHVVRPGLVTRLLSAGVAHCPVAIGEADVRIGPFVLPGRTSCLTCLDRHRTDADPGWPRLVDQLSGDGAPAVGQETVLAAAAAAVTAGQVLALLDGGTPAAADAVLQISLPEAVTRVQRVTPHPDCGCVDVAPPPIRGRPYAPSTRGTQNADVGSPS